MGGSPDLHESVAWPHGPQGALSFLAQLRMSDFDAASIDLPTAGVLSFFFDSVRQPTVATPPDVCVLLLDENDLAERQGPKAAAGIPETDVFDEHTITFEPMWTARLDPSDPAWLDVAERLDPRSEPLSFVGGQAYPIQESMESTCAERMGSPAPSWRLLLQLDSEALPGFAWGSGSGRLYMWVEHERLAARDFSRVVAIIQDS